MMWYMACYAMTCARHLTKGKVHRDTGSIRQHRVKRSREMKLFHSQPTIAQRLSTGQLVLVLVLATYTNNMCQMHQTCTWACMYPISYKIILASKSSPKQITSTLHQLRRNVIKHQSCSWNCVFSISIAATFSMHQCLRMQLLYM